MGLLRLSARGFGAMPRSVAVAAAVMGGGVAAFGLGVGFLGFMDTGEPAPPPRIDLQPLPPEEQRSPSGEIHGIVQTAEGDAVADIRVDLVPLFHAEAAARLETSTDGEGRFVFEDVEVNPGSPYAVDVTFDSSTFSSEVLRAGRGEDDPVRIVVAPTTADDRDIALTVESVAVIGGEGGLQAVHALTVHNRGDRAYSGGLRLVLLPDANMIDPQTGLDRRHLAPSDGVLVSTAPIPPGRHIITYTYFAPMPAAGIEFRHRVAYPTDRFELLVGGELEAEPSGAFAPGVRVDLGPRGEERAYQRFTIRGLEPGSTLSAGIRVAGSPLLRTAGLAAAAVAAITIFAFPLLRRRRQHSANVADVPVAADTP